MNKPKAILYDTVKINKYDDLLINQLIHEVTGE